MMRSLLHTVGHLFGWNLELVTIGRDLSLLVRCRACGAIFVLHGDW